jgi:hypothetical protein
VAVAVAEAADEGAGAGAGAERNSTSALTAPGTVSALLGIIVGGGSGSVYGMRRSGGRGGIAGCSPNAAASFPSSLASVWSPFPQDMQPYVLKSSRLSDTRPRARCTMVVRCNACRLMLS